MIKYKGNKLPSELLEPSEPMCHRYDKKYAAIVDTIIEADKCAADSALSPSAILLVWTSAGIGRRSYRCHNPPCLIYVHSDCDPPLM